MSGKGKEPDRIEHGTEVIVPVILEFEKTVIHKDGETYTGRGHTVTEANDVAGKKYSSGEKDK